MPTETFAEFTSRSFARGSSLLLLCLLTIIWPLTTATAQSPSSPVLLYAPESNLEHSEVEMLERARVSVDIAMYSFTDRELAEELTRLARRGVRVRVYRDGREYEQESQRGSSTTEILLAAGIEVRIKSSRDLMHLNYVVVQFMWCIAAKRSLFSAQDGATHHIIQLVKADG